MSGRQVVVGCDGRGRGHGNRRGGRGGCVNNNNLQWKAKKSTHISNTPTIKNDVFDCGKTENAAQFDLSKKAIVNYIQ